MNASPEQPEVGPNPESTSITIHYIKSNDFRVVHCDGAFLNLSPDGQYVHLSLFSERLPLPLQVTCEMAGEAIGKETSRVARGGFVREVELDAVLDIEAAERVAVLLADFASRLKASRPSVELQP